MENANVSIVKGELTFEDKVIQKIIGIALEEVDGLLTMDHFYDESFFSNLRDKMINSEDVTTGIQNKNQAKTCRQKQVENTAPVIWTL